MTIENSTRTGIDRSSSGQSSLSHANSGRRPRLVIVASHPIQYQVPLFRALSRISEIDVEVWYLSEDGLSGYRDCEFGVEVQWDIDLMSGYRHRILRNLGSTRSRPPFRRINPQAIFRIDQDDVILLHGWNSITNWMVAATAGVRGIPCLLRGETNGLHEPKGIKGWLRDKFLRLYFHPIQGYLAIGSLNRKWYRARGVPSSRIFHTPYAIETDRFFGTEGQRQLARENIKKELGIGGDPAIILFSGKLVRKKRPLDLLRAFERLSSPSVVVFVGDGELGPQLRKYMASENLRGAYFAGFQNQTRIPLYYQAADVVVVPSDNEMWGLVVNEAMAAGAAVVASNAVGAAADLIRDGENGFVYNVGDHTQLAKALEHVISDRERCRRMGRRSQELIAQWSIEVCVSEIVRAVCEVTKVSCDRS